MGDAHRSHFEMLNDNAGHLAWSNQRPFSRGQIQLTSTDPFAPPSINPRYGSNSIDMDLFREALRFNHRIQTSKAMADLRPNEVYPTTEQVLDDGKLTDLIKQGIYTEYHPTGTTSMLPLELGGVVSPRLVVYGTDNLRVVDSGIFPLIPAAHLMACVYGVAEKAAAIIKEDHGLNP